jgi:hypothetical protein
MQTESAYERIGGEDGVRRLTRRFYALMDTLPEAGACRAIHPIRLEGSEQKLFEYLTGWLGGPPLFVEKQGPPLLRARHLRVAIGAEERSASAAPGWRPCRMTRSRQSSCRAWRDLPSICAMSTAERGPISPRTARKEN